MPDHNLISSPQNQKIKNVVKLRERKFRDKTGMTIVEGFREIARAKESGINFEEFYYCLELTTNKKFIEECLKQSSVAFRVPKKVFAKIAFGSRAEGVLAVLKQPKFEFKDLVLKGNPLLFVIEKVEKPGNLGAILRTCDTAGASGLIISDAATDIYNPNVVRASIGTVFSVKTIQATNKNALEFLRKNNIKICVTTPEANINYTEADFKNPVAIVLGSEDKGVSSFWLANAETKVKIPMKGKADSLNVSTSAAVVIFEAIRQRNLAA
ncbi:MAG: RNA methyltransferase [Candidatus Omnitrophota bacterium]